MRPSHLYNENIAFSDHPLAPIVFKFTELLKSKSHNKMADDLLRLANFDIPEAKELIAKIILEMSKPIYDNDNNDDDIDFSKL